MKKQAPVYSISSFHTIDETGNFYVNNLKQHIKEHHFTHLPHKHDFYLVVLFTKGSGKHEVDFETYKVEPGSLFIMKPGQMHHWELSKDCDGFVFFHSKDFFDNGFTMASVNDFEFYSSFQNPPCVKLKSDALLKLELIVSEMLEEYRKQELLKWQKIHTLIHQAYIEITRHYKPTQKIKNEGYLHKVNAFEDLVGKNFKTLKYPKDYASMLHITEKHLNRITKTCLNKTSTQLIAERIVLEIKRMLIQSKFNSNEIADELGFKEPSYFTRFFKKKTGVTPMTFLRRYKRNRE